MIAHTISSRQVVFAYLYMPTRFLRRKDASEMHDKVCDRLDNNTISLQYLEPATGESKGFDIRMKLEEGRQGLLVNVSNPSVKPNTPTRILVDNLFTQKDMSIRQTEETVSAVMNYLTQKGMDLQLVIAEVRIRAQVEIRGELNGLEFMKKRVLGSQPWLGKTREEVGFASVKYEFKPSMNPLTALEHPKRELTLEPLKEDPASLYLETMSQWPQAISLQPGMPPPRDATPREILSTPGAYIEDAYEFLEEQITLFDNGENQNA